MPKHIEGARHSTGDAALMFNLALITKNSTVGMALIDAQTYSIYYANARLWEFFARKNQPHSKCSLVALFSANCREALTQMLQRVHQTHVLDVLMEVTHHCHDGQIRYCTCVAYPLLGLHPNTPLQLCVLQIIETTAQVRERQKALLRAEEALRANEALLCAGLREQQSAEKARDSEEARERDMLTLSHDLRGPLMGAKLAAQYMLLNPSNANHRCEELSARIVRSLDRTDRMLTDLLDANRIRAGHTIQLALAPCNLSRILREVISDIELIHPGCTVLSLSTDPIEGRWNEDAIRRIVWNLATNAIKHGEKGTPVTVKTIRFGAMAKISVHNQGRVISAALQKKIFEPFQRGTHSIVGSNHGWGLGLTLVRGFTHAMGGTVHVRSTPKHGTTFTVTLPLDPHDHALTQH